MARAFKGLPLTKGPDSNYQVIVIGAGVGGLICAGLLAQKGLKVLLVERHSMVGGFCSTFRRKGFTFDAASHFYPLLGNPKTLTGTILSKLQIPTQWVAMDPVDVFHFPDGSKFTVPAAFDPYLAELKKVFPHETQALDAFFDLVQKAYLGGLLYYFRGLPSHKLKGLEALTVRDVLDRFFQDRKLKLLLTADCPHWGGPPRRTSFIFDSMLRLSYFLGNYYPKGGSQVFADDCAARFEALGGHIMTKSEVKQITVEEGRVTGVWLDTGPRTKRRRFRVHGDRVISNGDLTHTVNELIGRNHFPTPFLQGMQDLKPSWPCFLTHLGLKDIDTQTLERIQGYYWDDWDPDKLGRHALRFKLFVPTLYEPAMAPPGKHVLIVQKVLEMDYSEIADWDVHKAGIESFITRHLAKLIPNFDDKIEVLCSASAKTSHKFTNNQFGAMLGWEMSPTQLGKGRPEVKAPLSGLYFTGHWTKPGGGITPVISSAKNVADLILKEIKT